MRKSHHARENVYGVKNTEMGITVSILQIRKPEHLKHLIYLKFIVYIT